MSRQFRYALAIWPFVLGLLIIFGLYEENIISSLLLEIPSNISNVISK
jgi:hypothetical protein